MRQVLRVQDVNAFDRLQLIEEIGASGLSIKNVHKGNGCIVIDFFSPLSEGDKTTLATVIANHSPARFQGYIVKSAEDVDKITRARINDSFGGLSPEVRQLGVMTKLLIGLLKDINNATSLSDLKSRTQQRYLTVKSKFDDRNVFIQEAETFKTDNNL